MRETQSGGSARLEPDILRGNRRALARAITLIESTRPRDEREAEALLTRLLPKTGTSIRIGITGPPGVGKSTFIEALGTRLSAENHRIAVLAVDPSSRRSGGSILGDKTRMEKLARDRNAFIRPSPAGSELGGVARRSRECVLLAEAAGFDVVLVETVGVGQSESAVAEMTDLFVVLVAAGGGDELQGIKRGVMELADLVLVTKADGDLLPAARRAEADYSAAMHLMRPKSGAPPPSVLRTSALTGEHVDEVWLRLKDMHAWLKKTGNLRTLRGAQSRRWFRKEIEAAVTGSLLSDAMLSRKFGTWESQVAEGRALPHAAARDLVRELLAEGVKGTYD
ncbi:MAG: methylmalonyl Co-A mutase-associated GTPase MeaB [Alphaproteobacteria bacterium]|nr:methylmalonyl Co-A mutase-associated GTPase MeaB [Alphaproteobacteria bacterium]